MTAINTRFLIVFIFSYSLPNVIVEPRRGKAEKRSDGGFGVGSYALFGFIFFALSHAPLQGKSSLPIRCGDDVAVRIWCKAAPIQRFQTTAPIAVKCYTLRSAALDHDPKEIPSASSWFGRSEIRAAETTEPPTRAGWREWIILIAAALSGAAMMQKVRGRLLGMPLWQRNLATIGLMLWLPSLGALLWLLWLYL